MPVRFCQLVAIMTILVPTWAASAWGQNVYRDYHVNTPRQYGPKDPWTVGWVMRTQMGYGGMFYNCDCEEQKRFSPYIDWNRQACVTCQNGPLAQVHQQIYEIEQRVRTGSCKQAQFCLSPECKVCEDYHPPICNWQTSPDPCAACAAAAARGTAPAAGEVSPYYAPNSREPQPAVPAQPMPPASQPAAEPAAPETAPQSAARPGWLMQLYRR